PAMQSSAGQALGGVGRGVTGALEMIPVVGNVINGVKFLGDIGNVIGGHGDVLDLLSHGIGMFVPQVGGVADMARGAFEVGGAAIGAMTNPMSSPMGSYMGGLPPWQMNMGG